LLGLRSTLKQQHQILESFHNSSLLPKRNLDNLSVDPVLKQCIRSVDLTWWYSSNILSYEEFCFSHYHMLGFCAIWSLLNLKSASEEDVLMGSCFSKH